MKRINRLTVLMASVATVGMIGAARAGNDGVYDLGQIHVTAPNDTKSSEFDAFGGSTISNAQTAVYGTDTLMKSVDLVPGVNSNNSGSQRNDNNVYVHGYDRYQVPLSIDGVRVYLPADNRLDFSRFLTYDISQIQIAKGYVSVLDGPGGLGGAINLVTKKPSKALEAEWFSQADFGNTGQYDGIKNYGRVGTRQDKYYLQASGTWRKADGWELPTKFTPTINEDGGRRDWSATDDWNINLKAGWTPNLTDEYSVNFIKQVGKKWAPYNVEPSSTNKYWSWPEWNVQILSAASNTQIGDSSYLKTKVFWETFDNTTTFWDNAAQTQRYTNSAANSIYQDWGLGTAIEAGHDFGTADTLKMAVHARRDSHSEWQELFVKKDGSGCGNSASSSGTVCFTEPKQTDTEDTYSVATENTVHVGPSIDLVQGLSYDYRHMSRAEDYTNYAENKNKPLTKPCDNGIVNPTECFYGYPLQDAHAFNWQMAAIWRYSDTAKLFANVSDRTRFPTLFERYASRFGSQVSNPDLKPEKAINYQIGWTNAFAPKSQVSVLVYYATVTNFIQSVYIDATSQQQQNVGSGYRYGVDFAIDYTFNQWLTMGGNISAIHNEITNPQDPGYLPTGIPTVKGMIYASYKPIEKLTLTPYLQVANDRWASVSTYSCGIAKCNTYVGTGAYALANFVADYQVNEHLKVSAGVKNIFDQLYSLSWGYPEAGRTYFVAAHATF